MRLQKLRRCRTLLGCQTTCLSANRCRRSRRGCLPCWSKSPWCLAPHSRTKARTGSCSLPPPRRPRCTRCRTSKSRHLRWRRRRSSWRFRWCSLAPARRTRQRHGRRGWTNRRCRGRSTRCPPQRFRRWPPSHLRFHPAPRTSAQWCGFGCRSRHLPLPIQNRGRRSSRPPRRAPRTRSRRPARA